MSNLFLTSEGLEIGELQDNPTESSLVVTANNVAGNLIRLSVGSKPSVVFRTGDIQGGFLLSLEQFIEVVVKFETYKQIIKFDSYNYTMERSLDQLIITIETENEKQK